MGANAATSRESTERLDPWDNPRSPAPKCMLFFIMVNDDQIALSTIEQLPARENKISFFPISQYESGSIATEIEGLAVGAAPRRFSDYVRDLLDRHSDLQLIKFAAGDGRAVYFARKAVDTLDFVCVVRFLILFFERCGLIWSGFGLLSFGRF